MEKQLKSTSKFKGRVFEVTVDEIIDGFGVQTTREVIHHSGGVCVYAEVGGEVLLVKQFRYPFNREFLELPAGKKGWDEEPESAALRELQEETGYQAEKLISMGTFIPTCAYDSEVIYLYRAVGLTFVGQQLDDGEDLQVERYTPVQLKKLVRNHEISDGKTMCLLMKVWMDE